MPCGCWVGFWCVGFGFVWLVWFCDCGFGWAGWLVCLTCSGFWFCVVFVFWLGGVYIDLALLVCLVVGVVVARLTLVGLVVCLTSYVSCVCYNTVLVGSGLVVVWSSSGFLVLVGFGCLVFLVVTGVV